MTTDKIGPLFQLTDHEIAVSQTFKTEFTSAKSIHVEARGDNPSEEIVCECGEEFDTRKEAARHLEAIQLTQELPVPKLPNQINWWDSSQSAGLATVTESKSGSIAKVEEGQSGFTDGAESRLTPPECYGFREWGELQDGGVLHNQDIGHLFDPATLKRALFWVTQERTFYQPKNYTIHFFGQEKPLSIEGPERVALVRRSINAL